MNAKDPDTVEKCIQQLGTIEEVPHNNDVLQKAKDILPLLKINKGKNSKK